MIFSKGLDDKIRDGTKTQTRRLVKEEDEIIDWSKLPWMVTTVLRNNRILWETWQSLKTYAIQPGRGKKGNGRFRIVKIRKERLQEISRDDCFAEGTIVDPRDGRYACIIEGQTSSRYIMPSPIPYFAELWDSIHKKLGARWEDNPEVWVLDIEYVGSN